MRAQWGWLSAVGRGYFLSSTVKNAKNINRQITVKKFQGIPNLTISADIHGHLAPEESEKPVPMFSKTLSLDITRPYNLLISENISKFHKWKAKTASKTQQLILIQKLIFS